MSSRTRPLHVVAMSEGPSPDSGGVLAEAITRGEDILIVPMDGQLTAQAREEMLAVSQLAPRIGAVIPRTEGKGPDGLRSAELMRRLPRLTYAPLASPAALWINGTLLAEFGEIFADGLTRQACARFLMRINRYGYRLAIANRAFLDARQEPGDDMVTNLASFPEASALLERYLASPEHRAEILLGELASQNGSLSILFDLDHLTERYNGTFEAALAMVNAAAETWPGDVQIYASAHSHAWRFHRLDRLTRVQRIDPSDRRRVGVVIRVGQPYTRADLVRAYSRSPVVVAFLLDAISYDCGYLSLEFDAEVWRFATQESDLVVTNSTYTLDCIRARFPLGQDVATLVSRHSLAPHEYARPSGNPPPNGSILIIGNGYFHKAVPETADAIVRAGLRRPVVAFGIPSGAPAPQGLIAYTAGETDQAVIERLYVEASVVVFPSHYEGFGFPILHALGRRRPVVVRDTPLNRELALHLADRANIHFYSTTKELIVVLSAAIPWQNAAVEQPENRHTWKNSADEVLVAIHDACDAANVERLARRLRRLAEMQLPLEDRLEWLAPEQRLALKLTPAAKWLFRVPGLRFVWRAARAMFASGRRI